MPSSPRLQSVFVPSLLSLFSKKEAEKAAPLSKEEALALRDSAKRVQLSESTAQALNKVRGYTDLDQECAWEQWQSMRTIAGMY